MKRETGYYWVSNKGEWTIAYYLNPIGTWTLMGVSDDFYFDDEDFDAIDEKIIEPRDK